MNTAWKVQLAEKLEEIEKKKAKQRMSDGGKKQGKAELPSLKDKGQSRDKVAKKLGISGTTYSKAKKVKKSAPKLWKNALDGK